MMTRQQLMGKPADKSKRVMQGKDPVAIYSDRVYWALVGAGQDAPEILVKDRVSAMNWLRAMPADVRAKVAVVRTYVTVWQLDPSPGPGRPRRTPRR